MNKAALELIQRELPLNVTTIPVLSILNQNSFPFKSFSVPSQGQLDILWLLVHSLSRSNLGPILYGMMSLTNVPPCQPIKSKEADTLLHALNPLQSSESKSVSRSCGKIPTALSKLVLPVSRQRKEITYMKGCLEALI